MKKAAVIYWSGTGNTEAMADLVANAAAAAGASVDKFTASEKPCQAAPFSRNYYSFDVPRTLAYLHVTDASKPLRRLYIHNFFLF